MGHDEGALAERHPQAVKAEAMEEEEGEGLCERWGALEEPSRAEIVEEERGDGEGASPSLVALSLFLSCDIPLRSPFLISSYLSLFIALMDSHPPTPFNRSPSVLLGNSSKVK